MSCSKVTLTNPVAEEEDNDPSPPPPPTVDSLTVTGVSGTLSHGNNITISGTVFGSVPQAAPLIWDDFENGSNNTNLANGWSPYRTPPQPCALYTNQDAYTGSLSAFNQISQLTGGRPEFATSYHTFPATDTVYCSYMIKYTVTGDKYSIMKFTRITSDYTGSLSHTPYYNGPGDFTIQYQAKSDWLYGNYNIGSTPMQKTLDGMKENQWVRIDMYKILSTPGVKNGTVKWGVNNVTRYSADTLITRETGFTFKQNSVLLGLMVANVQNDGFFKVYIDNMYVNNTQARVEIGNAATFNACTKREIQPSSAWASGSITVKLNKGTLSSGTAYLYVIDKNGKYNTNGYAITLL